MAEREVRYCTTEDGVRIAYTVVGDGPALVMTPFFFDSFSNYHVVPEMERFVQRLAEVRAVVSYDARGTGLSQRDVVAAGATSLLFDLEAVVAQIGRRPLGIWANLNYAIPAIQFAVRHAQELDRLVLAAPLARVADAFPDNVMRSFAELARVNWPPAAQTFGDMSTREADPEAGIRWGNVYRQSTTGEYLAAVFDRIIEEQPDVTNDLSRVAVPTMVLQRKGDLNVALELGQRIAAAIPNARFVPLDGVITHVALGDQEPALKAVLPFLDTRDHEVAEASEHSAALRTVLFTDIVGHTEMMQRLGDDAGRAVLRQHERITRGELEQHGGAEVKTDGDSFMASFASVSAAVECAVALQRAFSEYSATADEPLVVRIGLNVGEPIEEDGDYFGSAVILGARIKEQAGGGEILVPEAVRHLLSGKSFLFADRGVANLKGFEDAVRLYEVRWRDDDG